VHEIHGRQDCDVFGHIDFGVKALKKSNVAPGSGNTRSVLALFAFLFASPKQEMHFYPT
jgi:hypothetical protein